jgi:hypothetical protein
MRITEFLNPEDEVLEEPPKDVMTYLKEVYGHPEEEDYVPTSPLAEKIGIEEVLEALAKVSLFNEQQESPNQPLNRQLERYSSQIRMRRLAESQQTLIRSYFTRI